MDTHVDELAPLLSMIAYRRPRLIGVDGMNGVGKSRRVARRLGITVLGLDDFLLRNGSFIDGIDLTALHNAIDGIARPAVIEGCCLLAVMAQIDTTIDLHVYARRVGATGFWYDADVGEGIDPDHALNVERAIAGAFRRPKKGLAFDLIRYHADFRPMEKADIVVDLIERPAD